jgi:hypothetical protein
MPSPRAEPYKNRHCWICRSQQFDPVGPPATSTRGPSDRGRREQDRDLQFRHRQLRQIEIDFRRLLEELGIELSAIVPVFGREGDNTVIGFVEAGGLVSITLEEQVLVERRELISHIAQSPLETNVFRARLF